MCGAPLAPPSARREGRRTVTIVFSDLKGSTSLGEQLDSESLREALGVYFDEMRAIIERHGGTVEKFIGDAIMAVFGLAAVREDDALRAVRAARDMQLRLVQVNADLRQRWGIALENRTGVNTGEVVAGDPATGQRLVTGDTVNTAARLEQAAPVGEVLLGQITYDFVRDAVDVEPVEALELKGKADKVKAYRLIEVVGPQAKRRRLEAPLVGRGEELARLDAAEREVRGSRRARLLTVVAGAGVGKSRLIDEFLASDDRRARSLRGRCLSYGDGITFWPFAEMMRTAAGLDDVLPAELARQRILTLAAGRDDVAERLAPLLGLSVEAYPLEETFWAVRTMFEGLALSAPLVVVVDDIHWAEATLLDLLEHVREAAAAPILLVCSARPELIDERAGWGPESDLIRLAPLSAKETFAIAGNILGGSGLPVDLLRRISEAAEGNPLFVEQMLSMLVDSGDLVRANDGRWEVHREQGTVRVPPGIVALIDARLDRLGGGDRSVLQAGSVIGLVFYRDAVRSISEPDVQSTVDASLERLMRRQFVRSDPSTFMDDEAFRFDHALIHDGAYRSLLKRERADLHERFGRWLESVASQRIAELEEIIGYHSSRRRCTSNSWDHSTSMGGVCPRQRRRDSRVPGVVRSRAATARRRRTSSSVPWRLSCPNRDRGSRLRSTSRRPRPISASSSGRERPPTKGSQPHDRSGTTCSWSMPSSCLSSYATPWIPRTARSRSCAKQSKRSHHSSSRPTMPASYAPGGCWLGSTGQRATTELPNAPSSGRCTTLGSPVIGGRKPEI